MLVAAYAGTWWGLSLRISTTGPYSITFPFRNLGNLFFISSFVAIVSGTLLLVKKLFWISLAGVVFVLFCGFASAPIFAFLGFLWLSGLFVGSPLIALSAASLALVLMGYRKEWSLRFQVKIKKGYK